MNKNILTAAIGAAMIVGPLAAQADLKISGRVAGSLVSGSGGILFQDNGNARMQFDASDDSGWYARQAMDLRLGRPATASITQTENFPTVRDQYVGFKSGFGSFQFGRMAGAVKNLEGDAFIATFLELRNNAVRGSAKGPGPVPGGYGSSSFVNQMLQYANKSGDVSWKVQYNPVDIANGLNGDIGASVKAKLAGASVYAGYNNMGNITGDTMMKIGGSMKFGDINAKLHYEDDSSGGTNGTRIVLGASMGLGDGASVDVTYGDKGRTASEAYYRVAYMKKASKKARYWIGYVQNGNKDGSEATYGAGARVDF